MSTIDRLKILREKIDYKYLDGTGYFSEAYVLGREKEVERLHSIIKEVREYIKKEVKVYYVLDTKLNEVFDKTNKVKEDILEILDKENI